VGLTVGGINLTMIRGLFSWDFRASIVQGFRGHTDAPGDCLRCSRVGLIAEAFEANGHSSASRSTHRLSSGGNCSAAAVGDWCDAAALASEYRWMHRTVHERSLEGRLVGDDASRYQTSAACANSAGSQGGYAHWHAGERALSSDAS